MKTTTLLLLSLITCSNLGFSQVTAQWRGPERNGIYPANSIMKNWPETGPAMQWSLAGLGMGNSSAVGDGKRVYVTGLKDNYEYLSAIDTQGKLLWQTLIGKGWDGSYPESRCTPVADEESVYVMTGNGTIICLEPETGKVKWLLDALRKFEGKYHTHGPCESLALTGDKLIYTPGGRKTTIVALDKRTGETVWRSETLNDETAYVSPLIAEHNGKTMIITLLANYFIGVDADNGKFLWVYNFADLNPEDTKRILYASTSLNMVTPVFSKGYVYVTGGYNHGGAMFRLAEDALSVNLVWTDSILDCHHGGVILLDSCIYGSNWVRNARGQFCGIDWKTGKPVMIESSVNKGAIIAAGGMIIYYEEKGGIVYLMHIESGKMMISGKFRVPKGTGPHWVHPTITDNILYLRHGDTVMAYQLKGEM